MMDKHKCWIKQTFCGNVTAGQCGKLMFCEFSQKGWGEVTTPESKSQDSLSNSVQDSNMWEYQSMNFSPFSEFTVTSDNIFYIPCRALLDGINGRWALEDFCWSSWDLHWCLIGGLTPSAAASPVPTHVGLERPCSGGLRPAWNPECTNLFPALVMVSPARPGTFLEPSTVLGRLCLEPAVSAQPGLGSVRWVSLAKSIPRLHNHLRL